MNILTIDSSTDTFSASIVIKGELLGEFCYQRHRGQLIHLFSSILELMRITGITSKNIEIIGVTTGPGSFTGLRLGIITARTIAQILNIKIVPVNTLDAIAMNIPPSNRTICPMLDARRKEIFAAFYNDDGGKRRNLCGYSTFTIESITEFIKKGTGEFILTGNALSRYGKTLLDVLKDKVQLLPSTFWYPRGTGMIPLIVDGQREGKETQWNKIYPFYMRKSDAEENLNRKVRGSEVYNGDRNEQ